MAKDAKPDRNSTSDADMDTARTIREADAEAATKDRSTNPHEGEDPGLLPMNEDPRERRLKRNTM